MIKYTEFKEAEQLNKENEYLTVKKEEMDSQMPDIGY